jgi:hypothetical protein
MSTRSIDLAVQPRLGRLPHANPMVRLRVHSEPRTGRHWFIANDPELYGNMKTWIIIFSQFHLKAQPPSLIPQMSEPRMVVGSAKLLLILIEFPLDPRNLIFMSLDWSKRELQFPDHFLEQ